MQSSFIEARRAFPAIGKDPPLSTIPKDIRELIRQALADPIKALEYTEALDRYLGDLVHQNRTQDYEDYVAETRADLIEMVAQQQKQKSRARISVVATYIAPAFVTILARVITEHLPFG